MTPSSKHDDADRMIVTLTLAELEHVIEHAIDGRVRAAVRDELAAGRIRDMRPATTCSVAEAAAELEVTPRTIKRWIAAGRLQASRAVQSGSSRVRIARDSVDRLLRSTADAR